MVGPPKAEANLAGKVIARHIPRISDDKIVVSSFAWRAWSRSDTSFRASSQEICFHRPSPLFPTLPQRRRNPVRVVEMVDARNPFGTEPSTAIRVKGVSSNPCNLSIFEVSEDSTTGRTHHADAGDRFPNPPRGPGDALSFFQGRRTPLPLGAPRQGGPIPPAPHLIKSLLLIVRHPSSFNSREGSILR